MGGGGLFVFVLVALNVIHRRLVLSLKKLVFCAYIIFIQTNSEFKLSEED